MAVVSARPHAKKSAPHSRQITTPTDNRSVFTAGCSFWCQSNSVKTLAQMHTHKRLMALCPGLPGWAGTRRNIHPLIHPFPQPLSRSSLVFLLIWDPLLHFPINFFTQSSSFHNTCPYHQSLLVPMLCHLLLISLSTPYLESVFYLNTTHPSDHSDLCLLNYHIIFFPYRPHLTSMQQTASHTTAVQPFSNNQWYILTGKQWYQLPEFIPANSNSGLHSCISISIHTQHVT